MVCEDVFQGTDQGLDSYPPVIIIIFLKIILTL